MKEKESIQGPEIIFYINEGNKEGGVILEKLKKAGINCSCVPADELAIRFGGGDISYRGLIAVRWAAIRFIYFREVFEVAVKS